ncbi:hypothetical protein DSAG12_02142 [Promethearchaeum syntrophicum]|uniref:Uncharacterized protein n=1 Tax=Promethearchaeum syntrophicum TaxID=2594042 RepID=A0A5B9DB17_9ARCH|nr:hypothetical protein [Candidatus Prometheoarchaeum syntrophicum]QEE16312.1 hypothetical protein DSAG12_02142 [Candidatus Prometheoarchaeum syntrophicum]
MGHITTILAVVLLALVFQKNPFLGIAVIIFYIYFKYRKSRFYYNKLIVQSGRRNALYVKKSIEEGLGKINDTLEKFQGSPQNTHADFLDTIKPNHEVPIDSGVYKN